jgi:hypothetical protein
MIIRSDRNGRFAGLLVIFSVQAVCVALAMVAPLGNPVQAHEHTWPVYAKSLGPGVNLKDKHNVPSTSANDAPTCRLTIELADAATGQPLDGLVRFSLTDGPLSVDDLFCRGTMLRQGHPGKHWYVVLGSAAATVPQDKLTVEAFSGLETELAAQTIDLTGKATAQLTMPLTRFYDAAGHGWRNGNTHLHLRSLTRPQADRYLRSIARADGLELVFVSYLRRVKAEETYISNSYTREELNRLSGHGVLFDNGEEHRHNFGPGGEGYGHVMFLNIKELIRPVSIGPGIMGEGTDWPTIRRGIDHAHRDGATAVWCHNAWGLEDVPSWVAGVLDAHNIFDGGSRGSYEDSFYRFMNVGLRVPFSAGTDWFIYDFSRVYVKTKEPLEVAGWLEDLRRGRSFITNGPLLEFRVQTHDPGDVIQLDQPAKLTVRGRAFGRSDFRKIEVVHNGRLASAAPSRAVDRHFEAEIDAEVPVSEPGWMALRINTDSTNALGGKLFGHTSAVYVELAGQTIFKPEVAEMLIADMQRAMATIEEKANFADDTERDEVLDVYRQGIRTLRGRIAKHE